MNLLIIGASGTIGKPVSSHFALKNKVIAAARASGDYLVDIAHPDSIEILFRETGPLDAIVNIAGETKWGPLHELSEEDFYIGIRSKLMGQVNLARIGMHYLNPGGSITLSTGILADDPALNTTSAALVNGAIHGFVRAAALEMEEGKRINAVSLGVVEDAYDRYADSFPGHNPVPMKKVVNAYIRAVMGKGNGEVIRIYE